MVPSNYLAVFRPEIAKLKSHVRGIIFKSP
jgi:hypothetical protein